MWINAHKIPPEEELLAIRNAIVYFTAAHADLKSLRRGLTQTLSHSLYTVTHLLTLSHSRTLFTH